MTAFTYINIKPQYGQRKATLIWQVDAALSGGTFYVYRSLDGATGWTLLNDAGTLDQEYEDTTLVPNNLLDVPHYRILCIKDTVEYDSPIIGLYSGLSRKEYGACSKIIKMEYVQMSRADGIKLLLYKPKTSGELSTIVDPDTGQRVGAECPDNPDSGFGTNYKGGYHRPFLTVARFVEVGPLMIIDREDGLTVKDEHTVQARFLGYPHISPSDMLVNPVTDSRYAVTEVVKPYLFKGVFPVLFDAKLQMLAQNDLRYQVPVPATIPKFYTTEP